MYDIEANDLHHAPEDLRRIGEALDELCRVGCEWWALELHTLETLEATRKVVDMFLANYERTRTRQGS